MMDESVNLRHCDDQIKTLKQDAFKPMTFTISNVFCHNAKSHWLEDLPFAIRDEIVDKKNRHKENRDLEPIKAKIHLIVAQDPAKDDNQRQDE
jgi:hypothetical protein